MNDKTVRRSAHVVIVNTDIDVMLEKRLVQLEVLKQTATKHGQSTNTAMVKHCSIYARRILV